MYLQNNHENFKKYIKLDFMLFMDSFIYTVKVKNKPKKMQGIDAYQVQELLLWRGVIKNGGAALDVSVMVHFFNKKRDLSFCSKLFTSVDVACVHLGVYHIIFCIFRFV